MKRSEMIQKIQLELSLEIEEAESILNTVEKLGMVPPMCERGFDFEGYYSKRPQSHRWNREDGIE